MSTAHTNRKCLAVRCPHCGVRVRAQSKRILQHASCPKCGLPLDQSPTSGTESSSRRGLYALIGTACIIVTIGIGYLVKQPDSTKSATSTVASAASAGAVLANGAAGKVQQQQGDEQPAENIQALPARESYKVREAKKHIKKVMDRNLPHGNLKARLFNVHSSMILLANDYWPESKPLLPVDELISILQERNDGPPEISVVRRHLADVSLILLAKLGPDAKRAVPAIRELTKESELSQRAITALSSIDLDQLTADHSSKKASPKRPGANTQKVDAKFLIDNAPKFVLNANSIEETAMSATKALTYISKLSWRRVTQEVAGVLRKDIKQRIAQSVGQQIKWSLRVIKVDDYITEIRTRPLVLAPFVHKSDYNNVVVTLGSPAYGAQVRFVHPQGKTDNTVDTNYQEIEIPLAQFLRPGDIVTATGKIYEASLDSNHAQFVLETQSVRLSQAIMKHIGEATQLLPIELKASDEAVFALNPKDWRQTEQSLFGHIGRMLTHVNNGDMHNAKASLSQLITALRKSVGTNVVWDFDVIGVHIPKSRRRNDPFGPLFYSNVTTVAIDTPKQYPTVQVRFKDNRGSVSRRGYRSFADLGTDTHIEPKMARGLKPKDQITISGKIIDVNYAPGIDARKFTFVLDVISVSLKP